ncbi:MAG: ABC transporter permease [Acidobacteria bacterium]|nr:ABC transporter permease [Acidobacteriota bacterium]
MHRSRITRVFRFPFRTRAQVRSDVQEEFQFHLDMRTAELVESGVPEADARARAVREFGDRAAGAVACADVDAGMERRLRLAVWAEDLRRDAVLGWRLLWRSPGLSLVAILTLALGIGANTAIFSMFEQTLMRPLPVPDPSALVNLGAPGPKPGGDNCNQAGSCAEVFSYPMYQDLERLAADTVAMAAHRATDVTVVPPGRSTGAWAMATFVSGSYFPVLQLVPAMGRLIDPVDDDVAGGTEVAVLSDDYWRTQLGAAPDILGQTLLVNDHAVTIVGVAPRGFTGTTLGIRPAVFLPITLYDRLQPGSQSWANSLENRRRYWVYAFARLKPGVTIELARTALNMPYTRILHEVEAPLQLGASDLVMSRFRSKQLTVAEGARGQSRMHAVMSAPLTLLLTVTAVVLLIACANIANLLLVRSAGRAGEMAVRLSIGGSRWQLVRQLLTESGVLAVLGGLGGLLVARWTLAAVALFMPRQTSETVVTFALDWRALLFSGGLALAAALLFGLAPALHSTRPDVLSTLKDQSGQPSGAQKAAWFRTGLATAQIALAMALLVSAGLFVRSLANVSRVDLGLSAEHVVSFAVAPGMQGYSPERTRAFLEQLEERLGALPGVTSASASRVRVLSGQTTGGDVAVQGFGAGPDTDVNVRFHQIGPSFFRTMGMSMLAGREFTVADNAASPKVAIVNEAFVRKFDLGASAVGVRMGDGRSGPTDTEIVGVVRDAKYSDVKGDVPALVYRPYRQNPALFASYFYVRSAQPPEALLAALPRVVAEQDPAVPVRDLMTMSEQVRDNVFLDRMISLLSASFAVLATLMAALGLYGVLAYATAQRTREFGLRMALGAAPAQLRALILWQVARMTMVGGVLGLAAALALGTAVRSLLFGLDGYDPVVVGLSVVLLAVVAVGAGLLPAVRAARTDPMQALRAQ